MERARSDGRVDPRGVGTHRVAAGHRVAARLRCERGASGLEYIGLVVLAAALCLALALALSGQRVEAATRTAVDCVLGAGGPCPTAGSEGPATPPPTMSPAELRDRLLDPSLTGDNRAALLAGLTDDELLAVTRLPELTGTSQEVARMKAALASMVRLSPTLAREVTMLAEWGITIRVVPGGGASTYSGGQINLSEGMNTTLESMTEVLSHEAGHAVWDKTGIGAEVTSRLTAAGVDPKVANIVNESFAGIFGNRAHLAEYGRQGDDAEEHLAIASDILDNLANDDTFYAKYYGIDTAAARARWPEISAVVRDVLTDRVVGPFGLSGDPDLFRGL